jgi:hypothetical protein
MLEINKQYLQKNIKKIKELWSLKISEILEKVKKNLPEDENLQENEIENSKKNFALNLLIFNIKKSALQKEFLEILNWLKKKFPELNFSKETLLSKKDLIDSKIIEEGDQGDQEFKRYQAEIEKISKFHIKIIHKDECGLEPVFASAIPYKIIGEKLYIISNHHNFDRSFIKAVKETAFRTDLDTFKSHEDNKIIENFEIFNDLEFAIQTLNFGSENFEIQCLNPELNKIIDRTKKPKIAFSKEYDFAVLEYEIHLDKIQNLDELIEKNIPKFKKNDYEKIDKQEEIFSEQLASTALTFHANLDYKNPVNKNLKTKIEFNKELLSVGQNIFHRDDKGSIILGSVIGGEGIFYFNHDIQLSNQGVFDNHKKQNVIFASLGKILPGCSGSCVYENGEVVCQISLRSPNSLFLGENKKICHPISGISSDTIVKEAESLIKTNFILENSEEAFKENNLLQKVPS